MNYTSELRKFITSQYLYSAVRIALAIVIPSMVLAYFGLLKEYFLFPLGTSFVGLTDMAGPFVRRRNALAVAVCTFTFVAALGIASHNLLPLAYLEIIIIGIFFSMIGVYGQRLAAVGGLTLVVFSIFIDGNLSGDRPLKDLLIFTAGCIWFLLIFLVVSRLQPYKLASQMIGENYLQLAEYLKIKAKFYGQGARIDDLYREVIAHQVIIKNLQEETREVVFKTRTIVNESTTTSRLLMLMFLNSVDLFEKLFTSDQDYRKIHESFDDAEILQEIQSYLLLLSEEISNIGIALQGGVKSRPLHPFVTQLEELHEKYFDLRNRELNAGTLESFMALRLILARVKDISDDVSVIYKVFTQDLRNAKSLSTGLDFDKFVPKQERINIGVLVNNLSLKSAHFRHAVRITCALLLGFTIAKLSFLNIGHSYWILITIIAIMRPAYSTTKYRNLLRLYGTVAGAVAAYIILIFVTNEALLLTVLFTSMILCFALLKEKYAWAVFFMTLYIFITFNFLNPGNVNLLFKDRILDTLIAGLIAFLVSYFILPVWEHTQNADLMKKSTAANIRYFQTVINKIRQVGDVNDENYRLQRKEAIISLANLSDNFQRMLSDPKNRQKQLESLHQFVTTAHLLTAYTASLAQYNSTDDGFPEIDTETWKLKITGELNRILSLLNNDEQDEDSIAHSRLKPHGTVDELIEKRKSEISEHEFYDNRDPNRITRLTVLSSISEILELIFDVVHEQRKVTEQYSRLQIESASCALS
ncbi:FUSC family membrane protein [Kaistella sp. PBT33-4]|uniref:FUSC family protein n=1 Tax=Kaistella sp. PBT33-4 TaxID=3032000 RepID=UPI0023D7FEB4|nr:FUSC family membrane protein [Kaistella sp. PBT33-4]MDF0719898.1 FUSC family membrane protein [Kaistella sp. PBT33-4]